MIEFKPNTRLKSLQPQMVVALLVVQAIFDKHFASLTITSANDSAHMVNSRHYLGAALDFRVHHIGEAVANTILAEIKMGLNPLDFDVLLENPGTPNAHIHLEYDPK